MNDKRHYNKKHYISHHCPVYKQFLFNPNVRLYITTTYNCRYHHYHYHYHNHNYHNHHRRRRRRCYDVYILNCRQIPGLLLVSRFTP